MTDFLHEFRKYPNIEKPVDNGYWEIDYDLGYVDLGFEVDN